VTGRHRVPKRKLLFQSAVTTSSSYVPSVIFFIVEWYRALSLRYARAIHVFDIRAWSSSLLSYLCAKFRFCRGPRCWAIPWMWKILYSTNHSLTQLIWCAGNRSFRFGTCWLFI